MNRFHSVSQVELVQEIKVSAGTMSTMVTRLEKLGLISSGRHPEERRSDVLSLTEAERSQLKDVHTSQRDIPLSA